MGWSINKRGLKNIIIILSIIVSAPTLANGADTDVLPKSKKDSVDILDRLFENRSSAQNFIQQPYQNPAIKYYQYNYTTNEIGVLYEYRDESEAIIKQKGCGSNSFIVDVDSYIKKSNKALWGTASYSNQNIKSVEWNESSDYEVIYPYVMADTVGGDLNSEIYQFSGGYSGLVGRVTWGLEGAFKATTAYRVVDPRPNNITTDLSLKLGVTLPSIGKYRIGTSVVAKKYKQSNTVEFYSAEGTPIIYHITGLGTDYYRFRGTESETYYSGFMLGGNINLLPISPNGFWSNIGYEYFTFEKIIATLNNLPMAEVNEHKIEGELGYKHIISSNYLALKVTGEYTQRNGTENIFGEASNNIYPQISSTQPYCNKISELSLSALYQRGTVATWQLAIEPQITYCGINTTYNADSELSISNIASSLPLLATKRVRKWLLAAQAEVTYTLLLNSYLNLSSTADEILSQVVISNYNNISDNNFQVDANLRADYAISSKYGCYVDLTYTNRWYSNNINMLYALGSVGFTF